MTDIYDAIPKVELHCHVEGTVRPATVLELARKARRPLPVEDPAELYRYDSLDSFLAIFWLIQETLIEPDDWERIAYEATIDAAPTAFATGSCSSRRPGTSPPARILGALWPASRRASRPPRR